jgi:Flp pilus assembly pilin Flp
MSTSFSWTVRPRRLDQGQGIVEYALILALFVIVILLILRLTGTCLSDVYCKVAKSLNASATCGKPQTYCNDSFDNLSNWSTASGRQLNNGQLCNNLNSANFIFNTCSQTASLPPDYTVNIDLATLYAGNGYGVSFRQTSTNPANGYIFQFDPGLGMFVFRKWINGAETAPFAQVCFDNFSITP